MDWLSSWSSLSSIALLDMNPDLPKTKTPRFSPEPGRACRVARIERQITRGGPLRTVGQQQQQQ